MAYNIHYMMQFTDLLGVQWNVLLKQENYRGPVVSLLPGPTPLTIRYEGNDRDIFDPVRPGKIVITTLINEDTKSLFDDTDTMTDKTFSVDVSNTAQSYFWDGWLIPDERKARILDTGYYMELVAIDALSFAEGLLFTDSGGGVIQGKIEFYNLLDKALRPATNVNNSIRTKLNNELTYKGGTIDYPPYDNVLFLVRAYAENFLSSNSRPNKSIDVVKKIMFGLGMYIFRENLNFVMRNPHALTADQITTYTLSEKVTNDNIFQVIHTKNYSDQPPLLLGQNDVISSDRPAKELSIKFVFDSIISIVTNPNFALWDGTNFTGWTKQVITNPVYRPAHAKGRPQAPWCMRIDGFTTFATVLEPLTGMVGHSYRPVNAGTILSVSIKFKWYDYKTGNNVPANEWASMTFRLRVSDGTNTQYYFTVSAGNTDADTGTISAANHWLPAENQSTRPEQWSWCLVASSNDIQTISFETTPVPLSGNLTIELKPLKLPDPAKMQNKWPLRTDNWIEYYEVNIGEKLNSQGNEITGKTIYDTQQSNYSQIADTQTVEIGDTPTDSVSGALFKNGSTGTGQLTDIWTNRLAPIDDYSLIKNIIRIWMYFARQPKRIIECDIFSNTLHFEHLLLFKDGGAEILPGRYMQLTSEYDVRMCSHHIVAVRLLGAFKDPGTTGGDELEEYTDTENSN